MSVKSTLQPSPLSNDEDPAYPITLAVFEQARETMRQAEVAFLESNGWQLADRQDQWSKPVDARDEVGGGFWTLPRARAIEKERHWRDRWITGS